MNGTYRLRRFRRRWNRPVDVSIPYEYIYIWGAEGYGFSLPKARGLFLLVSLWINVSLRWMENVMTGIFFCLPRHGELSLRFLHLHGRL